MTKLDTWPSASVMQRRGRRGRECNGYNDMHSIQRKYKLVAHGQNIYPRLQGIRDGIILLMSTSDTLSYFSCHHDTRNRLGSKLEKIKKSPFKGFFQKMGNKLSCSCGPLKIKGYRFDDPWAANTRTRRNGHLLRSVNSTDL